MGQTLVKTIGFDTARVPVHKHSVINCPTGRIAVLIGDPNQSTITTGGAGTNNHYVHVYVTTTAAATAFEAPVYWSYNAAATTKVARASMAIDVGGHLHVVYVYYDASGYESIRYRKLTQQANGTFLAGAEEIVLAGIAGRSITNLDIELPLSTQTMPVIVASYKTATVSTLAVYNRNSATVWPAATIRTGTDLSAYPDVSIACKTGAATTGDFQYVVTYSPGPVTGTDIGDSVYQGRATIGAAHVAASIYTLYTGLAKKFNAGYRNYYAYALNSDTFMVYATIQSAPHKSWYTIFTSTSTDNTWVNNLSPRVVDMSARYDRFTNIVMSSSMIRDSGSGSGSGTSGTIFGFNVTASGVWAVTHDWSVAGGIYKVTEDKVWRIFSTGYSVASTALQPYAGDRGKFNTTGAVNVWVPYTTNSGSTKVQKAYLYTRTNKPTTDITAPAQSGMVFTNKPDIFVRVSGVGGDAGNIRHRVQLQVSRFADFTSGVTTVTQDPTLETYYGITPSSVRISLRDYPLSVDPALEATYGVNTWYARSRALDQAEFTGAWSATRTFKLSHIPAPINMSPRAGTVLVYDPAGSIFTWQFSDAYTDDYQTAVQIQVFDAAGATLVDTGKLAAARTLTQYTVVIPAAALDTYITYAITVWDADNTASPATGPGGDPIYLTQVPAPAITYPATDYADVNTSSPTYTWNSGVTGAKTQASYRVQVRNTSTGALVYDSNIQAVPDTSLSMPPNILKNGVTYTMSLTVVDSVGLSSTTTRTFDVVWIPPAVTNQPKVYLDSLDKLGFATVVVDTTGYDADILNWNIYRRTFDADPTWALVETRISTMPTFVFKDWFLPSGVMSEYAVTQVVNRFGDILESSLDLAPRFQVNPQSGHYWLVNRDYPDKSILIPTVTSDALTREYEEEVYTVINRGRQVEVGEDVGVSGSLGARIRPKDLGHFFAENYNFVPNSNLDTNAASALPNWTAVVNSSPVDTPYVTSTQENERTPGPGNREDRWSYTVQRQAAHDAQPNAGWYSQLSKTQYFPFTVGQSYYLSGWVNIPTSAPGYNFLLLVEWRDAANTTVILSETVTLNLDTTQPLTGSVIETRVIGDSVWLRLGRVVTVPVGAQFARVRFYIAGTAVLGTLLPAATVAIEGISLTLGSQPVQYFNGDMPGMRWVGTRRVDPAWTPGSLTPRAVRQAIETIKQNQDSLVLRNPFGDSWDVYVSGISVERVAGVGSSEFVDITIPYLEMKG
jgi:hypothetical protein